MDRSATPMGRMLLIAPDPLPKEIGSIALPEQRAQRPGSGVIVDSGPSYYGEAGNAGDRVIFGQYAGMTVKIDGTDYLLVDPTEILARWVQGDSALDLDVEGVPL